MWNVKFNEIMLILPVLFWTGLVTFAFVDVSFIVSMYQTIKLDTLFQPCFQIVLLVFNIMNI